MSQSASPALSLCPCSFIISLLGTNSSSLLLQWCPHDSQCRAVRVWWSSAVQYVKCMSAVLCTQRSEYQDMLHCITQHLVHGALNVFITLKCQTPFRMEWCPYARVCTPSSSIQRLSSSADRQSLDISTVFRTWLVDRKARNLALVVDVVFLRTWRKLVLYVFAFFCNLLPHDRLYIFALRPTNSVGGVEPVSLSSWRGLDLVSFWIQSSVHYVRWISKIAN